MTFRKDSRGSKHDKRTKVVITQSLNDLRNEEERKIYRMLFQYAMGILQDERVVAVSTFEERYGSNRRDQGPQ